MVLNSEPRSRRVPGQNRINANAIPSVFGKTLRLPGAPVSLSGMRSEIALAVLADFSDDDRVLVEEGLDDQGSGSPWLASDDFRCANHEAGAVTTELDGLRRQVASGLNLRVGRDA